MIIYITDAGYVSDQPTKIQGVPYILHQIWCIWRCKEILFHPFLGGYNYLTCSLFRVLRAFYEVIFRVTTWKRTVFGDFFTISVEHAGTCPVGQFSIESDIFQIDDEGC